VIDPKVIHWLFIALNSKVWTFILIATLAIVGSLTAFARVYSKLSIFIDSASKYRRVSMFERTTEYLTYMVNIMTNQGKSHSLLKSIIGSC
jgi:hypothetical protein